MMSLLSGSIPPVSISAKWIPFHSASAYILSLVTPGVSSTMETRRPTTLLKKVDFPTFGRPTTATSGLLIKNSFRKFYRIELLQILDPFSYTDKLDRHIKLIRYRNDDATLGGAVQLR